MGFEFFDIGAMFVRNNSKFLIPYYVQMHTAVHRHDHQITLRNGRCSKTAECQLGLWRHTACTGKVFPQAKGTDGKRILRRCGFLVTTH